MSETKIDPKWFITANVIKERPFGPGGVEKHNGVRLFRGGAKVYIIGAHRGMCEDIIVIGHHRRTGRFIQGVIKVHQVENIRMTLCYSPAAIKKVGKEYFTIDRIPTKEQWEQDMMLYKQWQKT
ncbi:MAG: hypothetical protein OQL19_19815 [Gammaproteobacteria bacterium]|nr:hypothetical protein [Gammaproteobacteria bacterium]